MIVQKHFGDKSLVFAYFAFLKELGQKPASWYEFFMFTSYQQAVVELRDHARRVAEAQRRT